MLTNDWHEKLKSQAATNTAFARRNFRSKQTNPKFSKMILVHRNF